MQNQVRADGPSFATELGDHRENVAVVAGDVVVTYAELVERVDDAAGELGAGRRLVLLRADNTLDALVRYLAALRAGHPVLLAGPGALEPLCAAYDPDVVIHGDRQGAPLDVRRERSVHALHPDLALLLSTSGSTGSPRLVRLSSRNLQANAEAISGYLRLNPEDRALTSLPMQYCYGLSVIHTHLRAGAAVVLTDTSVVDPCFWQLFRRQGATGLAGVPHTFDLLDQIGFETMALPTLRYVTQAGGRLPPEQVRRYAALGARSGWELFVMYGQTEATARMAYLPPERAATHPHAVGIPIAGGSFEIEPVAGLGPGLGQLVYRGPNVMLGYADGPADLGSGASIDALRTGDLARVGPDGLYEIIGRASRFVKLFGLRVDLDEVERRLTGHGIEAMCVGDDTRLVVVVADAVDGGLRRRLATELGLPVSSVELEHRSELPRLPNGKPDYASVIAGPRAAAEHPIPRAARVRELYETVLGVRGLGDDATFVSAGGDSLAYVEVSIELQERLGSLPEGWHLRPIGQLEAMTADRGRPARVEVGVTVRAVAIVVIVANHAGLLDIAGTAHVLLAVAGYNFARFQLAAGRLLGGVVRLAVPSIVCIGIVAALRDDFDLTHALLLRGPFGDPGDRWGYWFVEALVHLLVGCCLVLSIPAVGRLQRRSPFAFALGVIAAGLAVRFDALGLPEPARAVYRAHELLWIFGVGWAAAQAASRPQRLVVSAAAVVGAVGFFPDPARGVLLAVGMLVLVWVRTTAMPGPLVRPLGAVAGASLYIYLVHWLVLPGLTWLPDAMAVVVAVVCGLVTARLAERATQPVRGRLARPPAGWSARDEDALAGEGADADVTTVDLDGGGAVR